MRIPGPALLLPLLLSGCALPPAATVASLFVDGLSLVTTGKSTADHAISAVAREDCALFRVVDGREICDPEGAVLIALVGAKAADQNWFLDPETGSIDAKPTSDRNPASALEAAADLTQPHQLAVAAAASGRPPLSPDPVGPGDGAAGLASDFKRAEAPRGLFTGATPAAKPPEPPRSLERSQIIRQSMPLAGPAVEDQAEATFAVIGSFQSTENARRAAVQRGNDAFIQTIVVDGATTYRVLIDQPVEQARDHGYADAWPLRLCAADRSRPPCGHLVVNRAGVYLELAAR